MKKPFPACNNMSHRIMDHSSGEDRQTITQDWCTPLGGEYIRIQNFPCALIDRVPNRLVDAITIIRSLFSAISSAKQENSYCDNQTESPGRNFHMEVPVHDVVYWKLHGEKPLKDIVYGLCGDHLPFTFTKLDKQRSVQRYFSISDIEVSPFQKTGKVVIFRNDFDSLTGVLENAKKGIPQVLVTYQPSLPNEQRLENLFNRIHDIYPTAPMLHIPVWAGQCQSHSDLSRGIISLLLATVGCLVAFMLDIDGIQFFENGLRCLDWLCPVGSSKPGVLRATHPQQLYTMQIFLRQLTGRNEFLIENPYVNMLETEVVEKAISMDVGILVPYNDYAMSRIRLLEGIERVQRIDECIAIYANDPESPKKSGYIDDLLTDPCSTWNECDCINKYLLNAMEIIDMTEEEIGAKRSRQLGLMASNDPNMNHSALRVIKMLKRQATIVHSVKTSLLNQYSSDIAAGKINKTSLLSMICDQHSDANPQNTCSNQDEKQPNTYCNFEYSNDFSRIKFDGRPYSLTQSEAKIFKYLLKCAQNGEPEVHQEALAKDNQQYRRITDQLRKDELYSAGVKEPMEHFPFIKGRRQGTIKLNIKHNHMRVDSVQQ